MPNFLHRSNSAHLSQPARSTTSGPNPKSSTSKHLPGRSTTPSPYPSTTPAESPRPPRPKSTLGFSSKFAQSWKNSLKSSTSARSGLAKGAESPIGSPIRGGKKGIAKDGKEGGMQKLRRKVSMEWWAPPSTTRPTSPTSIPSTPPTLIPRPRVPGRKPRPSSWGMSPFTNLSASSMTDTPPMKPPPSAESVARTLGVIDVASPLPRIRRSAPDTDTPRTKAIHAEWKTAAAGLEGGWKHCLLGAVCISVLDPLEGIKEGYMKEFSPRYKPTIARPITTPTPRLISNLTTSTSAIIATAITNSETRARLTPQPRLHPGISTAHKPKYPTLAIPTYKSTTLEHPSSPSPAPRSRTTVRPAISPTPLSRRPLVARRTVAAPTPSTSASSPTPAGPTKAAGLRATPQAASLAVGPVRTIPTGITPRSAHRVRTSLKMTPLPPSGVSAQGIKGRQLPLPVSYIPLKAPAPSPSDSPPPSPPVTPAKWLNQHPRPSLPTSQLPTPGKGTHSRSSTPPTVDRSPGDIVAPDPITPPRLRRDDSVETMSPWDVVRPSPAFARKYEGVAADTDWVIATPLRRSLR